MLKKLGFEKKEKSYKSSLATKATVGALGLTGAVVASKLKVIPKVVNVSKAVGSSIKEFASDMRYDFKELKNLRKTIKALNEWQRKNL